MGIFLSVDSKLCLVWSFERFNSDCSKHCVTCNCAPDTIWQSNFSIKSSSVLQRGKLVSLVLSCSLPKEKSKKVQLSQVEIQQIVPSAVPVKYLVLVFYEKQKLWTPNCLTDKRKGTLWRWADTKQFSFVTLRSRPFFGKGASVNRFWCAGHEHSPFVLTLAMKLHVREKMCVRKHTWGNRRKSLLQKRYYLLSWKKDCLEHILTLLNSQ